MIHAALMVSPREAAIQAIAPAPAAATSTQPVRDNSFVIRANLKARSASVNFAIVPRTIQARAVLGGTLLLAASCHRPAPDTPPAAEAARPLAVFATQKLTVTPTQRVRPDSLGWVQQLGGFRVAARRLDT